MSKAAKRSVELSNSPISTVDEIVLERDDWGCIVATTSTQAHCSPVPVGTCWKQMGGMETTSPDALCVVTWTANDCALVPHCSFLAYRPVSCPAIVKHTGVLVF